MSNYYTPVGGLGIRYLGQAVDEISVTETRSSPFRYVWYAASVAGVSAGAYHGYKRNDSVGWAIGWALLGGVFPFITIPVSLAQGFAKPRVRRNRRRTSRRSR